MSVTLRRPDSTELARRVAAGDGDAFAALDRRYRRALTRYADSLLRSADLAEDVVQDVLIRAHAELRAGRIPASLRPWLYRLTRNRAIDELRRARWGDAALDDELPADDRAEPAAVLRRRETIAQLAGDLADLPRRQRIALLAREVDGRGTADVAGELGVSEAAVQMLAARARASLVKARLARDADHEDIQAALLEARERGVRASEHVRRHLSGCPACRAYARELRLLSRRLRLLAPPAGFAPLAGLAKLLAGGGGKLAAAVVAGLVVATTGGVLVLDARLHTSGDPAPFPLKGAAALLGRSVKTGDRLPPGTAVVTARVRLAAGAPAPGERRSIVLACPQGMRVAGFAAPEQRGLPVSYGFLSGGGIGAPRARITFGRRRLTRPAEGTVGLLCRRPGARGSLAAFPRPLRPGESPATVCVGSTYLYRSPGRVFTGTVFRGQPLAVQRRSRSGRWARVVSDTGSRGWVRAGAIRRRC